MKKNGFTLVELLAIIIVIGILVTITGPYVIRSIQTSRKSAFKNSAEGIIRVIQNEANENNYEEMNYTISDGTITDQNGNTLKTAGGNGETGEAYLDTSGRVSLAIQNKDKDLCAKKNKADGEVKVTNYSESDCKIGDIVKSATPETCFTISETDASMITDYTCADTDVVIPATINGVEVKSIGTNAFKTKGLTSVEISKGIMTIGSYAFFHNNLTSVTIPGNVAGIGSYAFQFNQLVNIEILNGVATIEEFAFSINQLTDVTIPESVTSIGQGAFGDNQVGMKVIIKKTRDSITGSPWGAASVQWNES